MMKRLFVFALAALMLALPAMSLAEAMVVDELDMTVEVPVGYTAEYLWDDGTKMLSMAILPTEEGTPVTFSLFAQYSPELTGVTLATMTDDQKKELTDSIATVIADPAYDVYTDESGLNFVSMSSGNGQLVSVNTIADSTLMVFSVYDEAGVSQDDLTVLESIIHSVNFEAPAEEAT